MFGLGRCRGGVLVVAGEGDEVVVAGGLVALEAAGHVGMILLGSWFGGFF